MSKKETNPAQAGQAAETFNKLMTGQETKLSFDDAFEMLDNVDEKALVDLGQEYYKFEKVGDTLSVVVEKFETTLMDGKEVEVVHFRTRQNEQYINGDKMLVSSLKRLSSLPAWAKIYYVEDVRNSKGTYKKFSVKTFPIT